MCGKVRELKAILIGGTSHAGKSTLAQALAEQLGWSWRPTDKLARHPGRPWAVAPAGVPPHVAEHYATLSVDELVADVTQHYRQNVWPLVRGIVASGDRVIVEGSAIWPELAREVMSDSVAAVWLVAGDGLLLQRIRDSSSYSDKTPPEKALIDTFVERSVAFNRNIKDAIERYGLPSIRVEADTSPQQLLSAISMFGPDGAGVG
jgi:2-phosphoglycerate kinase